MAVEDAGDTLETWAEVWGRGSRVQGSTEPGEQAGGEGGGTTSWRGTACT